MKKYTLCSAFLFASLLAESAFGSMASWPDYADCSKRITVKLSEGVSPDLLSAFGLRDIKPLRLKGFYSASTAGLDVSAILDRLKTTADIINAYVDEPVAIKPYHRDELSAAVAALGMERDLRDAAILRGRMALAGHFH